MRKVPLKMASMLGETSADYRWFAVVYLIVCFLLIPGVLLGLSFGGT
jgi:sodium-dependent phosphate cotransporter